MKKYAPFLALATVILVAPSAVQIANAREPILDAILNDVRTLYNKQQRPSVLVGVDGCLFDSRPRTLQILLEYGREELKGARPDAAAKLKILSTEQIQFLLADTLKSVGINEPAVLNNAAVFWGQRFFTDDYLKYDVATPGSVQFIRALYSSGARIIYTTERDAPRQLLGTVRVLRDRGYPIGIQGTELVMKPTTQTQDAVFKQQVANYLRHFDHVIVAFDSEPANVNGYRRAFPKANVVLCSAPHSPNPPPLVKGVTHLSRFQ